MKEISKNKMERLSNLLSYFIFGLTNLCNLMEDLTMSMNDPSHQAKNGNTKGMVAPLDHDFEIEIS